MNTSQFSQDSLAQSVLGDSTMMELGMDSLGRQPSLTKGFKSTGWDPFNNDGAVHSVTKMKKGKKGHKKSSKKMKAIELAKRGYERHMRQLEADKRRDRNLRMACASTVLLTTAPVRHGPGGGIKGDPAHTHR